jgi:hypothetical protein
MAKWEAALRPAPAPCLAADTRACAHPAAACACPAPHTCVAVAQGGEELGLEVDHLRLVLGLEVVEVGGVDEVEALHVVLRLLQVRLGLLPHLHRGEEQRKKECRRSRQRAGQAGGEASLRHHGMAPPRCGSR